MDIFDTRMKLTLTDLIDVVARHEKEIQELKQWVTMQQMPTKIVGPNLVGVLNAAGFYKKEAWVGLTDEELLEAYGWRALVENNRLWGDSDPMLEKARQDVLVGLRKVDVKLKAKNGG